MDAAESNGADRGKPQRGRFTRRTFMQTLGAGTVVSAVGEAVQAHSLAQPDVEVIGPGTTQVTLRVNGKPMRCEIEPSTTLLDTLRMHLNLTGSKEVCDRGACGACSVLIDGQLVASCMMLAVDAINSEITTVEGLGDASNLDPIQEAFLRHDALQCGYCTPGLLMASKALLNSNPKPSLDQIKTALSGNLCRCGAYTNIFNAVLDASGQAPVRDGKGA